MVCWYFGHERELVFLIFWAIQSAPVVKKTGDSIRVCILSKVRAPRSYNTHGPGLLMDIIEV